MTVNFSCDAMLSTSERYASHKFRRVSRWFSGDEDDALELVAFLALVPIKNARWIFHWSAHGVALAKGLVDQYGSDDRVLFMVRENGLRVGYADGLHLYHAMVDGGWKGGGLPRVVVMAFRHALKVHGSIPKAARAISVPRRVFSNAVSVRRIRPQVIRNAGFV